MNLVQGQDCHVQLSGQIVDKGTQVPLSYTTIKLVESEQGTIADSTGFFVIKDICPGDYHVVISHVGFEMERFYVSLEENTNQVFTLNHYDELLNEVVVHSDKESHSSEVSHTIGSEKIQQSGNKNLADLVGNIAGVSVLKNGSGISKPIIHGLYGNRVAILNNGLVQAGQQWGNDHAPEIDPFVADHLSVIKGVSGLQYSGGALGGVVLIEPESISKDPHLHGTANYIFQSNGLGHTVNSSVEKSGKWAAWRATGTLKMIGDNRAPNYYLTNTGSRLGNIALQSEKNISERLLIKGYYSFYHTEIGILRGSHIGNLTDLEEAIGRSEPFYTKDYFSYSIDAPRQKVNHHLLKLETDWMLSEKQMFTFKYGGQANLREEYDVRRSGRSDRPALSLALQSHFVEGSYEHFFDNQLEVKVGIQNTYTNNKNDNEETGILPLIPDYQSNVIGGFATLKRNLTGLTYEVGARYDLKDLHVVTITTDLPRRIERFDHLFHNYSLSGGLSRQFNSTIASSLNLGYVQRSPEVNELYSNGLHQGVSGIERGNRNLGLENSLKAILTTDVSISNRFFIQAIGYFQQFDNYTYLQPDDELELTIRGAFPVFNYLQTDAQIFGADIIATFEPYDRLKLNFSYAYLKGIDTNNNLPLINMPPNNLASNLTYSLNEMGIFKNNTIFMQGKYVFRQNEYEEGQDFLAPPPGYFLLDFKFGTSFQFKKSSLNVNFLVENALNTTYRDYLNRLRYFADETGINLNISVNYNF